MKEYFGDSTGRYYSDVMDIADIRPLLCDRCLAIFERHVPGDGAEFCRKCEAKLTAVLDAARELRNGIDLGERMVRGEIPRRLFAVSWP